MQRPLNRTLCSSRKFSSCSFDEKFSSRDTARHLSIFFGTRATQYRRHQMITANSLAYPRVTSRLSTIVSWHKAIAQSHTLSHKRKKNNLLQQRLFTGQTMLEMYNIRPTAVDFKISTYRYLTSLTWSDTTHILLILLHLFNGLFSRKPG